MRYLFFSLTLAITLTHAQAQDILMTNFSGDFNNPRGSGQVERFSLEQGPRLTNAGVSIALEETNLLVNVTSDELSEEFLWEDLPVTVTELNQAQWSGLNLNHNGRTLQASARALQTNSKDTAINLSLFNLQCDLGLKPDETDSVDHVLNGCLNLQSKLNLRMVDLSNNSGLSLVSDLMQTLNLGLPSIQATNRFENVEIDIKNNDFTAAVTTKVVINATIRMNGKTYFDKDEERVRIRIDRARAGFLNVTSMLFDELEKISSEKVQVNRPWISIDLTE